MKQSFVLKLNSSSDSVLTIVTQNDFFHQHVCHHMNILGGIAGACELSESVPPVFDELGNTERRAVICIVNLVEAKMQPNLKNSFTEWIVSTTSA